MTAGPRWLIEEGIGETRSLIVKRGEVLAAKLIWPGECVAGQVHEAQLIEKLAGAKRGLVTLANGTEALISALPSGISEGAQGRVTITRAPIAERGRLKRAQARWLDETSAPRDPIAPDDLKVRSFDAGLWEDIWQAASSGSISFAGGEILCSVTPAMTVIDIDGDLPPRELAMAAIPAIAKAIHWFDLGGNIGIDFPTLQTKADRRAGDDALAKALGDWPHECTAMNGFGFVQIIARLEGPSLLHRFATSRTGMCARYALRMAERAQGIGPVLLLTFHPALKSKLKSEWIDELSRRTGKQVRIATNPALALESPQAQITAE